MGTLVAYGSYLNKKVNVVGAAASITVIDMSVAFFAGLLILPTISLAQGQGVEVYDAVGSLIGGPALILQVLPQLFLQTGGVVGALLGLFFFGVRRQRAFRRPTSSLVVMS